MTMQNELKTAQAAVDAAREHLAAVIPIFRRLQADAQTAQRDVNNEKLFHAHEVSGPRNDSRYRELTAPGIPGPRGAQGWKPPATKLELAAAEAQHAFNAVEARRAQAQAELDHAEALLLAVQNAKVLRWIDREAREFEELRRTGAPSPVLDAKLGVLREAVPDMRHVRRTQQLHIPDWIRQLVRADVNELDTPCDVLQGGNGAAWERRRAAILAGPDEPELDDEPFEAA
jgi:hypothetical protein